VVLLINAQNLRIIAFSMLIIGLVGAFALQIYGEDVVGANDFVPWGLLIVLYLVFALASVGVTFLASLWYIFGITKYKAAAKHALPMGIILVLMAFVAIGLELGKPFKLYWIVLNPNIQSAIWWMGFIYTIYLGFRIMALYAQYKKENENMAAIFNILTALVGVGAVITVNMVFSNAIARPFWHGPSITIYFLIATGISGTAILSLVLKYGENNADNHNEETIKAMERIFIGFLCLAVLGIVWKVVGGLSSSNPAVVEATKAFIHGSLSITFWIFEVGLGIIIPLILLLTAKEPFRAARFTKAAIFALIGVTFMLYNLVIGGQIIRPNPLHELNNILLTNAYRVSLVELAILLGTIGGVILLQMWYSKKLFSDGHKPGKTVDYLGETSG
jgi:molybdopterin-containing oxidoreductase family membrane subunit